MERTNRNIFGLDGITGMIIATVLLLTILVILTMWGIAVQKDSATKYYDASSITGSLTNVKANSVDNAKYSFIDAK